MSHELAIAIDATNLREGGGISHLAEILRVVADHDASTLDRRAVLAPWM